MNTSILWIVLVANLLLDVVLVVTYKTYNYFFINNLVAIYKTQYGTVPAYLREYFYLASSILKGWRNLDYFD